MSNARIIVAFASHDFVPSHFAYDLARLHAHTVQALPEGVDFGTLMVSGSVIQMARQELLEGALEADATHVLWLDADMRFPPDTLTRLLAHRKPFVGVNYSRRGHPLEYVAMKRLPFGDDEGERLNTGPNSNGLEEVEACGFGVVLIRRSVLDSLPPLEEGPWFDMQWDGRQWHGEDVLFCKLVRSAGHTIYVDHDLSKEVGHIGQRVYRLKDVWEVKPNGGNRLLVASR